MKKNTLALSVSVVLVVALATSHAQVQRSRSQVELLEAGTFYSGETTAKTGEEWLGLHVSAHNSQIIPYRLTVRPVEDTVDERTGKASMNEVTVDQPLEPLFLLKDATMLSVGPVLTIFGEDDETSWKHLVAGQPIDLAVGGVAYSLEVIGSGESPECSDLELPHNARLVLKSGDKAQTLYSLGWHCGEDSSWSLIWAGDLDRDGKLDLYLSVSPGYSSEKRLFLSSQAGGGRLVREIAVLVESRGC